jgi:hypothetical protein
MPKPLFVAVSLIVSSALAACGGTGPAVTDASGSRVQIGGDTASVGGPGSPGWPQASPSYSGHDGPELHR